MYIAPSSEIRLLHNVPLDTSYEHSIYFNTIQAQTSYFLGLTKKAFMNCSYQRANKNSLRVEAVADDLYDCNYLMFRNTNFGSKWFYAYIQEINYINNSTTEIIYDMDVIQTWYFNFTVDECLVQRTHTTTDVMGAHILPEPISITEYVYNDYHRLYPSENMIVIVAITNVDGGAKGAEYDGIYGGASLVAHRDTDYEGINSTINDFIQKPDAITSIYMCPANLVDDYPAIGGEDITGTSESQRARFKPSKYDPGWSLNGYYPKNNKLFTYPYNFYQVDNGCGNSMSLRYEFFLGYEIQLEFRGTITQPVMVKCAPYNYKGANESEGSAMEVANFESLTISGYPMCSWNIDAYEAWIAQNSIPMAVNAGVGMVNAVGTALSNPNPIAGIAGGVQSAMNTAAQMFNDVYTASIAADISKGSLNNGGINTASKQQAFHGGRMSIPREMAEMIDDFFTMYGYAVNKIMRPIYNARPYWTYIKTVDATITGSVPSDDMRRIINIFNTGVTFWTKGEYVGNYSLDNRPTT